MQFKKLFESIDDTPVKIDGTPLKEDVDSGSEKIWTIDDFGPDAIRIAYADIDTMLDLTTKGTKNKYNVISCGLDMNETRKKIDELKSDPNIGRILVMYDHEPWLDYQSDKMWQRIKNEKPDEYDNYYSIFKMGTLNKDNLDYLGSYILNSVRKNEKLKEDVNDTFITKIKEVITKNQSKYPEVSLLKVEKANDNDTYHFEFNATKDFLKKNDDKKTYFTDKADNYQKLTDLVLNTGLNTLGTVNKPLVDDFDIKVQNDGFVVSVDIKIRNKELDEDINENEENLDIIPDVGTLIIRNNTIGEIIKFPNFKYTDKRDLVKQIDYFADHLGDNIEVTLELAKPRDEEYYVDNIDGFDTRTIVGIHIAPGEEEKIYTFEG